MPRSDASTDHAPATPRSRKGTLTKARLIESARAVFEQSGFLEARIVDIAEGAGMSHGSFYHYFDSKEQIFREVADAQEAALTAPANDGVDTSALSPIERIRRANRVYLERYRDNAKIMGVIEEVSRYDAHVNEARLRRQRHFAERAERAIRRWQKEGVADPKVDPAIAALALGAMMGRFAELWLVMEWAPFDFDRAVDQMTRLWANAIGLPEPPSPKKRSAAKKRSGTTR